MDQMHVQPTDTGSGLTHNAATEEQLWSYLVQLASALRVVHSAGLACRAASLAPSKVPLTCSHRVYRVSLSIAVALQGPSRTDRAEI